MFRTSPATNSHRTAPTGARRQVPWALAALVVAALAGGALADDVTVTRKGKKVTIECGGGDDSLSLGLDGDTLIVAGLDTTTVNGDLQAEIPLGPRDTVVVNLGGGSNAVTVNGDFPKFLGLTINGGDGFASVGIDTATIPCPVKIVTGTGGGNVQALNSTFQGKLTVIGGAGNDMFSAASCTLTKGLRVTLGADSDEEIQRATLQSSNAGGPVALLGGSGTDELGVSGGTLNRPVTLDGGAGDDALSIGGADFKSALRVRGKDGNDSITVSGGPDFTKAPLFDGGAGDDTIAVNDGGFFDAATILGGPGDDGVLLGAFTILGDLKVNTSSGDDIVTVGATGPDTRNDIIIDGGKGQDSIDGHSRIPKAAGMYKKILHFESNTP